MKRILEYLKAHFDTLQDRYGSFARHGVQVEGWFKGELLLVLDRLRAGGAIHEIDREVAFEPSSRRRIDLVVTIGSVRHWIELKHWLIGEQSGTRYRAVTYFSDPSSVGILSDVRKLSEGRHSDERWLLVLNTTNPGREDWQKGIKRFEEKFDSCLEAASNPDDFPSSYFLGLLRIRTDG